MSFLVSKHKQFITKTNVCDELLGSVENYKDFFATLEKTYSMTDKEFAGFDVCADDEE